MQLSIIIPTKNRPQILSQTLLAICEATKDVESEIIVVNDSVHPINLPLSGADWIRVVQNPKLGVASARNFGARLAAGSLLLFMDDDIIANADAIATTLRLHETRQWCCVNLNWIYPPALTSQIQQTSFGRYLIHYGFTTLKGWNRGNHWDEYDLFATDGITSQYLSMRKQEFDLSGGYNEVFPHAGFEDYEFAKRLRQQGFAFYIYPQSSLWHNETDRQSINLWLDRRRRGGQTRRVAAELGHSEVVLHYPAWKSVLLYTTGALKPVLLAMISALPGFLILDKLKFKLIGLLLAEAIFKGYNQSSDNRP